MPVFSHSGLCHCLSLTLNFTLGQDTRELVAENHNHWRGFASGTGIAVRPLAPLSSDKILNPELLVTYSSGSDCYIDFT